MENKTRLHIVLACFAGAFIGALLGLELATVSRFLWIPSALVGGLIAYLTYDLQAVGAACRRAWQETDIWKSFGHKLHFLANTFLLWIVLTLVFTGAVYYFGLVVEISAKTTGQGISPWVVLQSAVSPSLVTIMIGFSGVMMAIAVLNLFFDDTPQGLWKGLSPRRQTVVAGKIFALGNLLVLPFTCLGMLGWALWRFRSEISSALWWLAKVPWSLAKEIAWLAKRVFVLIHSDVRTICFVDAAIGATVGYFVGSALIGGLIGATAGLLNYEVVSIHLLKLRPAHAHR